MVSSWFHLREQPARSILSRTSGFIAAAGFTHSLTPARNCTYGCTYCYVPTMRVQGGLQPEDWRRWGQFTTFKTNAAGLLRARRSRGEVVYCSPLVDPYQPAEAERGLMPDVLDALIDAPPSVFTIQTRGPLITRDVDRLARLGARVSFSLTTDREDIRRWYEPHCAPLPERLAAIRALRAAGVRTFATLAPILPCDPEALADAALEATTENILGDPLHVRRVKPNGATTRPEALKVCAVRGFAEWQEPAFMQEIAERIGDRVRAAGREFRIGPEAFQWLAQTQ